MCVYTSLGDYFDFISNALYMMVHGKRLPPTTSHHILRTFWGEIFNNMHNRELRFHQKKMISCHGLIKGLVILYEESADGTLVCADSDDITITPPIDSESEG